MIYFKTVIEKNDLRKKKKKTNHNEYNCLLTMSELYQKYKIHCVWLSHYKLPAFPMNKVF